MKSTITGMFPKSRHISILVSIIIATVVSAGFSANNGSGLSVSFNGKFVNNILNEKYDAVSENGRYSCRFNIVNASDEYRELAAFRFYENGNLLYSLKDIPGSDVYISNSGIAAVLDQTYHFKGELTVNFFSKTGSKIYSRNFKGASLFGFSPDGELFGVGTSQNLLVINPREQRADKYKNGYQFDISRNGDLIAVAAEKTVYLYSYGTTTSKIYTGFLYPRKVRISPDGRSVAVIDKRNLLVFGVADGSLVFADSLTGDLSFRDLAFDGVNLAAGIHYRNDEYSKGILRTYDLYGNIIADDIRSEKYIKSPPPPDKLGNSITDYDPVPWPFAPFDSMRTVWNHYEQHMGSWGADFSYLHQGLDIITPVGEPVYAVQSGIVKCVLTLGGAIYWRIAISPEQDPGYSSGWLYAHLVESSIQFDVGDTVEIYDYLGDIIHWSDNWGHIHFVEITDQGLVWQYFDDEWGINYNPLMSLPIAGDTIAPVFEYVFPDEKLAFCPNEINNIYLDPDSLFGDIDIIVKTVDYIGGSQWQQPAFRLDYWVASLPSGVIVYPRTMAQILNHSYSFYESNLYEPYATLLYKRDDILQPTSWMEMVRNYHQILTNNNGDSLAELWEKQLSFHTTDYPDGAYRIFVEAFDAAGNSRLDSMDVYFSNGIVGVPEDNNNAPVDFALGQNYPNPFNSSTVISYSNDMDGIVTLKLYDISGRLIETIYTGYQPAGIHTLNYSANNLSSGIYFYRIEKGGNSQTRRMIFLK